MENSIEIISNLGTKLRLINPQNGTHPEVKIIQSLNGKKSFHLYSLYKGYGYSEYFSHRKVNNPLSQLHMRK